MLETRMSACCVVRFEAQDERCTALNNKHNTTSCSHDYPSTKFPKTQEVAVSGNITTFDVCKKCEGTGSTGEHCKACDGTGTMTISEGCVGNQLWSLACIPCSGRGRVSVMECSICGGTGRNAI